MRVGERSVGVVSLLRCLVYKKIAHVVDVRSDLRDFSERTDRIDAAVKIKV